MFLLKFRSFYQIARRHITEDDNFYSYHCRKFKVYAVFFFNFKGRVGHSRVVVMRLYIIIIIMDVSCHRHFFLVLLLNQQ